jgi:ribosomal-protein-alanine N-acetyltransferase
MTEIDCGGCRIRPPREGDAPSLAGHANDREIWRNLRDGFPHPYALADAEAVGGIGLHPGQDVERFGAELGYWLGRPYWGQGLTTAAVRAVTGYGFEALGLERVFALPYARNPASARVLEKAGFTLEGVLRRSAFKDGEFVDQRLYAALRAR